MKGLPGKPRSSTSLIIGRPFNMKAALIVGLIQLLALQVYSLEIAWGQPVNGISVGLTARRTHFHIDEKINVIIIVKNESEDDAGFLNFPLASVFRILATRSDGKSLPEKPAPIVGTTGGIHLVLPGRSVAYELPLRDFVEINSLGEFTLTAKHKFAQKDERHEAFSRSTTIQITEASSTLTNDLLSPEVEQALEAGKPRYGGRTTGPEPGGVFRGNTSTLPASTESPVEPIVSTSPPAMMQNGATKFSVALQSKNASSLPAAPSAAVQTSSSASVRRNFLVSAVLVALLALVVAIFWRAARRKPNA